MTDGAGPHRHSPAQLILPERHFSPPRETQCLQHSQPQPHLPGPHGDTPSRDTASLVTLATSCPPRHQLSQSQVLALPRTPQVQEHLLSAALTKTGQARWEVHVPSLAGPLPAGAGCTQQPGTPYLPHETSAWDAIGSLPNTQRTCSITSPRCGLADVVPGATHLVKPEPPHLGLHSHSGRDGLEQCRSRCGAVSASAPSGDATRAAPPASASHARPPQPLPCSVGPARDGAAASSLHAPSVLRGQHRHCPDTQSGTTGAPGPAAALGKG